MTSHNMETFKFIYKIKHLREKNKLLQREVASKLNIDTPMLSKIERGQRKAKREHVEKFAKIYKYDKDELITLWLADQVYSIIKEEKEPCVILKVAEEIVEYGK